MAKGIGLIGNFRGKVGNMVGYNLKDSNNKQTQGVRVYQPVVKNPKTYGQAEQRAKLAPINATYRALKAIIDRGQEGKAYGNKSRLAWLSAAMKAFNGGWFDKGAVITAPALVPLTKGSLQFGNNIVCGADGVIFYFLSALQSAPATMGALSAAIIADNPLFKLGDQITFVAVGNTTTGITATYNSITLVETTDATALPSWMTADAGYVMFEPNFAPISGCVIVSREGNNGEHLRTSVSLLQGEGYPTTPLSPAAKEAAIKSYMAAGANTDWAEESLQ